MNFLEHLRSVLCAEQATSSEHSEEISYLRTKVDTLEDERDRLKEDIDRLSDELSVARGDNAPDVETEAVDRAFVADALYNLDGFEDIEIWRPMNDRYVVPTQDAFEQVIAWDATDAKEYERDYFDCVDFTKVIRALFAQTYRINAVGNIITYGEIPHACNVVVFADGTARLFEPQDDEFVAPNSSGLYQMDGAVVHI